MENNKMEEMLKENYKTIKFEDYEKQEEYILTKEKNGKYYLEVSSRTMIEPNDKIDDLFNQMDNYYDSINQNDYWPKTSEYPDMMILWSANKTGKDSSRKDGALGYPEGWDSMLDKIKDFYKNN